MQNFGMKILNFIGHPIFIISSFLLILISGEAFGGPYIVYLFFGLPHGAGYSLFAAAGIICLSVSLKHFPGKINLSLLLQIFGILFLLASLFLFFQNERLRYNDATFIQTVPVLTLILFGTSIICLLISHLFHWARTSTLPRDHSPHT